MLTGSELCEYQDPFGSSLRLAPCKQAGSEPESPRSLLHLSALHPRLMAEVLKLRQLGSG